MECNLTACGNRIANLIRWAEPALMPTVQLMARLLMARIFFYSGLTKLDNWNSTLFLFQYEYSNVPILPPEIAAYMAATAELTLPIFLVLGLGTRFAALGLFGMTMVIELFVYPGTMEHYYWMVILGLLVASGGGRIALDRLFSKRWMACSCTK